MPNGNGPVTVAPSLFQRLTSALISLTPSPGEFSQLSPLGISPLTPFEFIESPIPGIGRAAIAFARGTPVLATDPELIRRTGTAILPSEAELIALTGKVDRPIKRGVLPVQQAISIPSLAPRLVGRQAPVTTIIPTRAAPTVTLAPRLRPGGSGAARQIEFLFRGRPPTLPVGRGLVLTPAGFISVEV